MLPHSQATRSPGRTPSSPARRWARRSARAANCGVGPRAALAVVPLDDALAAGNSRRARARKSSGVRGSSTASDHPLASLHEHVLQHRRLVGHDAVDAEVEQAVHLGARRRSSTRARRGRAGGRGDEAGVGDAAPDPLASTGTWAQPASVRATTGRWRRQEAGQPQPGRRSTVPMPVHNVGPRALRTRRQAAVRERADADAVDGAGAPHHVDERLDGAVDLGVDVEADPGQGVEQVLEARRWARCRRPSPPSPRSRGARR